MKKKKMDIPYQLRSKHGDVFMQGLGNEFTSYLTLPGSWGGWAELTVEAWINPTASTNDLQAILSSSDSSFIHFQMNKADEGNISIYTDQGNVTLPVIPEAPYNTWRHVAVTSRSGATMLFIDGEPIGETNTKEYNYILPSSEVYIGGGYERGRPFNGKIADLKVWAFAKTQETIHSEIYNFLAQKPALIPPVIIEEPEPETEPELENNPDKKMDTPYQLHSKHGDLFMQGLGNEFSGTESYIALSGSWGGWAELIVEAWINPSASTNDFQAILSSTDSSFVHLQLNKPNEGDISIYTDQGRVSLPVITEAPFNIWRHVAVTSKSGATTLFIDGMPYGETNTKEYNYILPSSEVYIGCGYEKGRHFNGKIADLKIWAYAKEHEDIYNGIYQFLDKKPAMFPPVTKQNIGLKSHHGKYLSAQPNGTLECNRNWLRGWEIFEMQDHPEIEGAVTLLSRHNTYLTFESDKRVSCGSNVIGPNQIWRIHNKNGKVGLQAANNKYLSAQPNGNLDCDRNWLRGWELFEKQDA